MYGMAKKIWQKGEPTPDRRIKKAFGGHLAEQR